MGLVEIEALYQQVIFDYTQFLLFLLFPLLPSPSSSSILALLTGARREGTQDFEYNHIELRCISPYQSPATRTRNATTATSERHARPDRRGSPTFPDPRHRQDLSRSACRRYERQLLR